MCADLGPTRDTPGDGRAQARRRVVYLAGFAAYGLGLSTLYATTGVGLPCPFRALTGWSCPFCGATRMGAELLHGNIAAAAADNLVVLVSLGLLTLLGACWVVQSWGGPALRLSASLRSRLARVTATHGLVLGLCLAVGDTLLRNLS